MMPHVMGYPAEQVRHLPQFRTLEQLREPLTGRDTHGMLLLNPETQFAELVRNGRLHVMIDGEDVTNRTYAVCAAEGWVDLLVPRDPEAKVRVWKLNADKTGPEIERRTGRVEVSYDFQGVSS